jgi:hypothetical protein
MITFKESNSFSTFYKKFEVIDSRDQEFLKQEVKREAINKDLEEREQ